jgi:HD-GYP domain-containing protein (c-di-GMP phosphodiesterase class II)
MQQAEQAAERYRTAVESLSFPNLSVTISLGVSDTSCGATSAPDLLNQADKSLYSAKRTGRNRVLKFTDVTDDIEFDEDKPSPELEPAVDELEEGIPFHAVTALISALGYRDAVTAEHSRRVADLAVAAASGLMSSRDCYVLEIAALLHDIGKIGVPDSILLKPGPLTQDEWKVMDLYDDIGVDIVASAFSTPQLTEIVRTCRAYYGGGARNDNLPDGQDIPLAARILSIADAYDAMVSERVYRKARTPQETFAELRRCAGVQFDGDLVEQFIMAIEARDQSRDTTPPDVSKEAALRVGLQIEKVANALDDQDTSQLALLAGKLKTSAIRDGVPQIAELADRLEEAVLSDVEFDELVNHTRALLELCRATQRVYLEHDDAAAVVPLTSPKPSISPAPEIAV